MARFQYRAVDRQGSEIRSFLEAASRPEALRQLRLQPITLLELSEAAGRGSILGFTMPRLARRQKLSQKELIFVARQLANLLKAGTELDRGLDIVKDIASKNFGDNVIVKLTQQVRAGKSLAEALSNHRNVFPIYFISMVRVGEAAGSLDASLMRLADLMERQAQTRSRLISSLIYPTILLLATVSSVILIMTTVVPQFEPIFQQAGQELPLLTRIMVGISHFLVGGAPYALIGLIAASALCVTLLKRPDVRLKLDRRLLSVPLIGSVARKLQLARLSHVLGALLQGGVPLVQALTIAAEGIGNLAVRQSLERARELVKNGVRLSSALKRQDLFPRLFLQLIDIGEESARLSETLFEIARIYDDETEAAMQRTVTMITPLATITLGGIVALVLASILLAVLKVNDLAF